MRHIAKNEAVVHQNAPTCKVLEYGNDGAIDGALIDIDGRYPERLEASNKTARVALHIIKGSGKLTVDNVTRQLAEGDTAFIAPGEKYHFEGTFQMFMCCTPPWSPEQYEEVEERRKFRASAKAAIYSEDASRVIVMDLIDLQGKPGVGLPGGHVEHDETPDEAMARELEEELGIEVHDLKRVDFFMHPLGKLVLGFTGRASSDQPLVPESEWRRGRWVSREEFEKLETGVYKPFTLAN